jgi:predicted transcriptional regulator
MPITEELNNLKKFESAGFTHEQSEVLADVIEKAQVSGQESLKEFIHNELNVLRGEFKDLENRLLSSQKDLEIRMMASQKDLLIKIFGIIVGSLTIAVTILKLFP